MKTELTLLVRSLVVQGSWNYRTLLGAGMAWVLLPVLRSAGEEGEEALRARLARHAEHFNAHPYLTPVALGALQRLEREGADPERIRRFRRALGGPLGSLGDALIWSIWRPACVLFALVLVVLGAAPLMVTVAFLFLYNLVHLGLRVWGLRVGSEFGFEVAGALGRLKVPFLSERIGTVGVLLVGLLVGALAVRAFELPGRGVPWLLVGGTLFLVGFLKRDLFHRWMPALALALVVGGFVAGAVRSAG